MLVAKLARLEIALVDEFRDTWRIGRKLSMSSSADL